MCHLVGIVFKIQFYFEQVLHKHKEVDVSNYNLVTLTMVFENTALNGSVNLSAHCSQ